VRNEDDVTFIVVALELVFAARRVDTWHVERLCGSA
jgi:hypothetical protein